MDTSGPTPGGKVCFDGNLFELVKRFLSAIPGKAKVPDELVYATHSARVRVEGDCSILDEILNRVKERRARSGNPEQLLEALLEMIAAGAIRCRTGLMWGEVTVELDYGGGRQLCIVSDRGASRDGALG